MSAQNDTALLQARLSKRGIELSFNDVNTLRRAQITLQRWYEQERGDSDDYAAYAIERDPETEIPYRCVYPHREKGCRRTRIADKEAGAKRRVDAIVKREGLFAFYQTDPRGCALYISAQQFDNFGNSYGIACCV